MPLLLAPTPFYHAYARGCEAAEEQSLELVYNLDRYFDGCYPVDLLVFVLRELNPRLVLESDPDAGRRDWPWLNDENLDALERGCRYYLGEGEPVHEQQLHAMLAELHPGAIVST